VEIKREAEDTQLNRLGTILPILEMWQGSQNLLTTQKESRTKSKQMTAVGYISDIEVILQASWPLYKHDIMAAFKLSGRSPLPPALSEKNLPGGQTEV
jgi:hypothetical protein